MSIRFAHMDTTCPNGRWMAL